MSLQFYYFNLMPYAALNMEERKKHETAWLNLPSRLYDREDGRALYERWIGDYIKADALGFDGLGVNEHHQTAYGMMPSPIVIASILARETKRAKICILGSAIPLRDNPLTLAEEHAMIDTISGGRLISGFVRGIGAEYHVFGTNPALSHERFHEAHDLIIKAWTSDEPFTWEGRHYEFETVNLWPKPYQRPYPRIFIPSQGSRETIVWAAHPDRKYTYCQTFSPIPVVKKFLDMYKETAADFGYECPPEQLAWSAMTYVAETDAQAIKEVKPHFENFRNYFLKMPMTMLMPPGYSSVSSLMNIAKAKGNVSEDMTAEQAVEQGYLIAGSPETVRQRIEETRKLMGYGHFMTQISFGTMPKELGDKNLQLFATEVMQPLQRAERAAAAAQ